jgi:hypothetical protein
LALQLIQVILKLLLYLLHKGPIMRIPVQTQNHWFIVDDADSDNGSDEDWKLVSKGLPDPLGTIISVLAVNPKIVGEFYALNNRGIFCSTDSGISWKMLNDGIEWSKEYLSQHPMALAVSYGNS